MNILIERKPPLKRIDQVPYNGKMRYYYIADKQALFHLVSRVGPVELLKLPAVLDASLGWGEGWHGKCHPHHEGLKLTKVTLHKVVEKAPGRTLREIIEESKRMPREAYRTKRWRGNK